MTSLRSGDQDRITQLMEELKELRSQNMNLRAENQHTRKRHKPGSVSFRTLMNALQRLHDKQTPKKRTPGHESRVLLANVITRWMKELDELSHQHGYEWRKVADRPHARTLVFNVDV